MERGSARLSDKSCLEEEQETLLKDSDTQDSSTGCVGSSSFVGQGSALSPVITCTGSMFRSRQSHEKGASGSRNKDVNIPLVRDRDSEEAAAMKAVQAQESKRRKRRIMKIAVYVMFGVIALGVFAIWLFHKDAIESIKFKNNFIFTVKVQTLEIKTDDQDGLLYGELGLHIKAAPFFKCSDPVTKEYEESCLYWKNKAYLRISHDHNVTDNCYTVSWEGMAQDFMAEDCFYLQKYNWFGYMMPDTEFWPIRGIQAHNVAYYSQYPNEQDVNLVPGFFGSQGIAIFVHSSYPISISWNNTEKRQLCILSQINVPKDFTEFEPGIDQFKYTICQGKELKDVYYNAQQHRHSWEVELKKMQNTIQPLLEPLLTIMSGADAGPIMSLMQDNVTACSFLQLPAEWEHRFGDLQFDDLAQEIRGVVMMAKKKGCGVVLPISTFFTFNSRLFEYGIDKGYFLRDELDLVTKMVSWKGREGAVLDTTNSAAVKWYLHHLELLLQNSSYNIKGLKLLHIDVPPDAHFFDSNMTFLDYSRLFYRDASLLLNITLIIEHAMGFVSEPVFVSQHTDVNQVDDAWCFNDTIPWALNLGVNGYPLIIADASKLLGWSDLNVTILKRWLELAIFFPAFEIPNIPLLKDSRVASYLRLLMEFRANTVLPYMESNWAKDPKAPILRPLWWHSPQDRLAQQVSQQFLIGDGLMVAPILCDQATKRSVYLPTGRWKTTNEETLQGPKTLYVDDGNWDLLDSRQTSIIFWEVKDT